MNFTIPLLLRVGRSRGGFWMSLSEGRIEVVGVMGGERKGLVEMERKGCGWVGI
jgi:hypothetical protein